MKAVRCEARRFMRTVRDGAALYRLAPAIPLLAFVAEFAQHVAEMKIGLFESRARFDALALDPARMDFGYLKIAGLWVAILLAARFWANRAQKRFWLSTGSVAWRPLLTALGLMAVLSIPALPGLGLTRGLWLAVNGVVTVVTLPLGVLLMAGLLGDQSATLRGVYRTGWGTGLRIIVTMMIVFVPLQALHLANHLLALGLPEALVWLLMAFDSVVIGLLAAMLGTALHHGYAPPE